MRPAQKNIMQKIIPSLWFDKDCEAAINFYVSIFPNSKIVSIQRYPDHPVEGLPMEGLDGKVLTAIFELEGQRFMALDGGSVFKFNPTVSFFVNRNTPEEVDALWNKLADGGSVLMPLEKYPFSEKYGWLQDKYGLSWQIGVGPQKQAITPSFMFVGDKFGKAEEAVNFYVSVFKNASVKMIARYEPGEHDEEGKVKYSEFLLEGQEFTAMESSKGHSFEAGGAVSFYVECGNQAEVDYYWSKLTEGGDPKAQQCGWLQDKYGFSWQIVPKVLGELLSDPDKEKADRAMKAMLQMKKLDVAALEKAAQG